MNLPARPAMPRPSVMKVGFPDLAALHAAYIPWFTDGGLFVPTERPFQLGDSCFMMVSLPGEAQRAAVAGKVAWITPVRAAGNRTAGVGVRLPRDAKSQALRRLIEEKLAPHVAPDRMTHTI
ncbi:MAG: PilZ domain-containing protein [Rhodoferax sp.]